MIRPSLSPAVRASLLGLALLALSACSTDKTYDPTGTWSAERLYKDAKGDLDAGNWSAAVKSLQKLETRFPFGKYGQQAQLDMAYANYRAGERAEALVSIDRFIRLNPTHERLDYAYYLKGLINFNTRESFVTRLSGQDLSERDQQSAREAWESFRQVVTRFPDSPYARDSLERMNFLVNSMAQGQVHIARYYHSRGAYVAAVNRAQSVIEDFPRAPAMRDALELLVSSYDRLGLEQLRDDARRVLERTYARKDDDAQAAEPLGTETPQQMPGAARLDGRSTPIPIEQIPNATRPLDPALRPKDPTGADTVPMNPMGTAPAAY